MSILPVYYQSQSLILHFKFLLTPESLSDPSWNPLDFKATDSPIRPLSLRRLNFLNTVHMNHPSVL